MIRLAAAELTDRDGVDVDSEGELADCWGELADCWVSGVMVMAVVVVAAVVASRGGRRAERMEGAL